MAIVDAFRADTLLAYAGGLQPTLAIPLNSQSVLLSNPQSMVGDTNTQVVLSGTGVPVEGARDVYVGQVSLTYDRLDLGVLFLGILPSFQVGVTSTAASLYDWLDDFSELYGVKLYAEDVADLSLSVTEDTTVVVSALATSLNYTGSFSLSLIAPTTDA